MANKIPRAALGQDVEAPFSQGAGRTTKVSTNGRWDWGYKLRMRNWDNTAEIELLSVGDDGGVLVGGKPVGDAMMTVVEYLFNNTLAAPPGAGQMRLNALDQTTATLLWLDDDQATGGSLGPLFVKMKTGDRFYCQEKDNDTRWQRYELIADAVDADGYVEFPVVWLDGGGAPLPEQRVSIALFLSSSQKYPTSPTGLKAGAVWCDTAADNVLKQVR